MRNHVDVEVIGKERLVVAPVGAHQSADLQEAGLPLLGSHTDFRHFGGQQSLRLGYAVLYVHRSHVGVRALLEIDLYGGRTGIGGGRADVHHVLHTVDALLQRHDDTVQHGFGIGAGVVGTDIYRRRRNVRILFHRQRKERNEPYHQNQYGDGDSHHRPFYKYVSFHLNGSLIVDKIAIIISLAFLRAAVRHLWKQSRHPLSVRPAPRIRVRHLFLPR